MEKILSFIENNKNIDAIQFELSYDSDAQAMLSIVRFQANLYSEPNSDVRKLKRALDKDFGSWDGKKHEYGNIR